MSKPTFSVILPTYHRNELLAKCLDCLKPGVQTLSAEQYEVIVTDDGRTATAEQLIQEQYPWVKWVAGPCKGPAANRNNGAKFAQGKWLVFTDDDCLPDVEWLEAYSKVTTGTALALEGAIHPLGDPDQDLAECPVNLTGGCFWSANIAIQRKLFEEIGGFDHNYPLAAHEDQDLKLRIEGCTAIAFVADAKVLHPVRVSNLKESLSQIPKRCDAWVIHTLKNQSQLGYSDKLDIFIFGYKFQLTVFIRSLFKHHFKESFVALAMLVVGLPLIAKRLAMTNKNQNFSNRYFNWISSTKGDFQVLADLSQKMLRFYSQLDERQTYQEMLNTQEDLPSEDSVRHLMPKYICELKPESILEVGCANGRLYRQLRHYGFNGKYTGLEVAEYIIQQNREHHPGAVWKCATAYEIPFPDQCFDACFSLYVLEHLVYPERGLKEMLRVLKPGGQLILVFPDFVESGRFSSQQLGFSPGTASRKFKSGKIVDALISLYDSRVRLPNALKKSVAEFGSFPINYNPLCFNFPSFMDADVDAVYVASKQEVFDWATSNGYQPSYPYGCSGELVNQAFMVISK